MPLYRTLFRVVSLTSVLNMESSDPQPLDTLSDDGSVDDVRYTISPSDCRLREASDDADLSPVSSPSDDEALESMGCSPNASLWLCPTSLSTWVVQSASLRQLVRAFIPLHTHVGLCPLQLHMPAPPAPAMAKWFPRGLGVPSPLRPFTTHVASIWETNP